MNMDFINACKMGDLNLAIKIYSHNPINIHANNESAFCCACERGHIEVALFFK